VPGCNRTLDIGNGVTLGATGFRENANVPENGGTSGSEGRGGGA